nr:Chain A, AMYLOID BETA PEPTIDE [Homo sapiens]1QWP_A Chain A, 11-mer peptide from Amyloid beta A4 protein [synthetic construct]1QXC_A Chain A, 11-mer peptide from Amyloid beta A4 protein [synthetic construct]1QYT_A Chain A, 11-mer peptide from Amyloid beta A4 protein [synthetic construct]
GSNKGAIIGLM